MRATGLWRLGFSGALACILSLVGISTPAGWGCTTAVISGRVTSDGRPLLWKNRDTSQTRNEVVCFEEGPLRFIAVVNAGSRGSVWMGVNEAGFCIENSLSKDLGVPGKRSGAGNGAIMKRALATCRNLDDFLKLMAETDASGRRTVANFGVIDAVGGAGIIEAGPNKHAFFDANDPEVAPRGYLVRSNFATTAQGLPPAPEAAALDPAGLYSAERYQRACQLVEPALEQGNLSVEVIVQRWTRDLTDATNAAFPGDLLAGTLQLPEVIDTKATISRSTTVSAAVFQGVRLGEPAEATTMWVQLGDPKFSIAVPCWATLSEVADPLEGARGAEVGEIARTLRDAGRVPEEDRIETRGLPGIWSDLLPAESQWLQRVAAERRRWAARGFDRAQAVSLHQEMAAQAMRLMTRELQQAKAAALQRAPDGEFADTPRLPEATLRVAIYDHADGSANGPKNLLRLLTEAHGFVCERLHPDEIRGPRLQDIQLLIVPGGSGSLQSKKLGPQGRDAIRSYVRKGGGYMGICAGTYLASSHYSWSLNLINARVWDRAHWARGTGTVGLCVTEDGRQAFAKPEAEVDVYYGQGPLLLPDDEVDLPPYEVLATYGGEIAKKGAPIGAMGETHAIVRTTFGAGRVVGISPHPEKSGGPDWMIRTLARWAAGNVTATENATSAP